jgi:rare lipoprotein A (peptidoglycan hydrolase)
MAVNTQKLLPAAKGSPLAKISTAKITKGMSIKTKTIDTKKLMGSKEEDQENIKQTLLNIDSLLKSILGEEKKNKSKKRKEKEKADFEKEEKKLEAPKEAKKFKLPGLAAPGMSFLDRIKRFLFFTALGWLFTKFQDQLPKLEGIVKTIAQVYVVAEDIFKSLLSGVVNFIDIGYQTYDGLRKQVENLGGKDAVKTFDEFSSHLNKLINGAIIAATLIASTTPKTPKMPTGGASSALGASAKATSAYAQTAAGKSYAAMQQFGNLPKWAQSISASSAGRFSASQSRIIAGTANIGDKLRVGTRGFIPGVGQIAEKVASKGTTKVAGSVAQGAKFGGGRIPIIGPLITFLVRRYVYGEKPEKAAAAAVGTGIGQAIGGFIGTIGAGALGLGTAGLGAVVAPLIIGAGSVIGGLVGEWLGALLYDFVVGSEVPKPQLKAAGGSVTRGGKRQGPVTRSIKITRNRRPPKVKPKQSQPGKDVGGKKNIQKLYPDTSAIPELEGAQQSPWYDLLSKDKEERDKQLKKLPNSYKALTGVAKKLKEIPFGIGSLMGGAVDIALGQKLPQDAIDSLGNGIAYLINAVASQQVSASISDIGKEISKMQTGGVVPRLRDFSKQDQMGSDVNKVLNGLIRQKVDEAIKEVQKQMMPGKFDEGGRPTPPPGTTSPGTTSPGPPPTGKGLNQPNVKGKSGYQGSTNVVDTGLKDYKGRPIKLNPGASQAFKQMISEGMPFKSSDVTSVYRDESEYLRLVAEGYSPASNSAHNYGEGADIHGSMGEWIKKNGKKYGWYYVDYPGTHGGHFEWKGSVAAPPTQKVKKSGKASWYGPGFYGNRTADNTGNYILKRDSLWVAHKTLPFGTKVKFTYNGRTITLPVRDRGPFKPDREWDLTEAAADQLGLKASGVGNVQYEVLGKKDGGYIPKQSPNRKVSSLRSYPSYSDGGVMIAIQPMIIEKPVPIPMGGNKTVMFPVPVGVNNSNMPNLSRG